MNRLAYLIFLALIAFGLIGCPTSRRGGGGGGGGDDDDAAEDDDDAATDDDDAATDDDDAATDDDDAAAGDADGEVPCSYADSTAVVDIWEFNGTGGDNILVDTVSASTVFDPFAYVTTDAGGDYGAAVGAGDDENPCTFPPATYGCPEFISEGEGTVYLVIGGYEGDCNGSGVGSYAIVANPNMTQVADDTTVTIAAGR